MASSAVLCLFFYREEREQRRADIEHLAGSLVNKVNECVAAIDEGKPPARAMKLSARPCYYATSWLLGAKPPLGKPDLLMIGCRRPRHVSAHHMLGQQCV